MAQQRSSEENRLINFIQRELESQQLDVSDMSIKNIIDEGIKGVYEDYEGTTDNILQPIHDQPYFMAKKEHPVMDQVAVASREHNPEDDFPFDDYVNLASFPLYLNPQFVIFLKATSLFNSSLLFENDLMSVFCRTERLVRRGELQIALVLTYHPLVANTLMSVRVHASPDFDVQPAFLSAESFDGDFEQVLTLRQSGETRIVDFPMLHVALDSNEFAFECRVPLPFSVNKFVQPCQMSVDGALKYLEHVN